MILIELKAAIDAAGTVQTFYMSDAAGGYTTGPTDTPPNEFFDARIVNAGTLGVNAFSDGRTGGGTKLEVGEIILANSDGGLDAWLNYSFDGRPVTIRTGQPGGAYPGAFANVLHGTVESIDATFDRIVIRLRDKQFIFDKPALSVRYGGTNALPAGLDGTANDLKGKTKPKAYGKVFNVAPPCVNTSRLIYETGVVSTVDAVYDRGVVLTAGAAYVSLADMESNAPAAGQFRAWPAGGYIRLGSTPAGLLTADLTASVARQNLLNYTENLSGWTLPANRTIYDDRAALTDTNAGVAEFASGAATVPAGVVTFAVDMRADVPCTSRLAIRDGAGAVTSKAVSVGRDWVRHSISTTNPASTAGAGMAWIYPRHVEAETGTIEVRRVQFEAGPHASPYLRSDGPPASSPGFTAGQVLVRLALDAGIPGAEISGADAAALDAANGAVVGVWLDGDVMARAAMDQVAASVGAFYGFDADGVLRMARLTAPTGAPVATLEAWTYKRGINRRAPRDASVPTWRVALRYMKLWNVQATDLAGAVAADRRAFLANEYRTEVAADAAIKTQWLMSGETEVSTLLTTAGDASTEAARLLALYKARRDVFDVPVPMEFIAANNLNIMDLVSLVCPRFGTTAGRLFRVIGKRVELGKNQAILTLWG